MTLDRVIRSVLSRTLPSRFASEAADDLLDDSRQIASTRGRVAASWFLARESISLMWRFGLTALPRLVRSMVVLRRDTAHAMRALVRRPWSNAGAILMLAAGLAAIAASTGLASTLLFRPISARYPDEILRLAALDAAGRTRLAFSEAELEHVRENVSGRARLAVANLQPVVLRAGDADTQTLAEVIGGDYFDLIGLGVSIGRPLVAGDAAPNAAPVIVISDVLWRDRFGREPSALGATVQLNRQTFTIVGVTAGVSTSNPLGGSVDAWIATAHADAMLDRDWRTNPARRWWTTIIHVEQGAANAAVQLALERAGESLKTRFAEDWRERRLATVPGTVMTGRQRGAAITLSIVLTGFAVLILGAAAANVSGVFLAAAAADRGRAAIQLAIGSGRAALVRRHLIEGGLLGAASGVASLALYFWIRRQLAGVALLPTLSLRLDLPFDATTILSTIGIGAMSGALLALGPALWVTRLDVAQTLRDGAGPTSDGVGLSRARRVLVAAQVAICVALLSGATLFARSLATLATLDLGFERAGLIAMDFDLEPSAPAAALPDLARDALRSTSEIPGVLAAAMSSRAPIDSSTPTLTVETRGTGGRRLEEVTFYLVTDDYFATVGVPLVRGRAFTFEESSRERDVAIINETAAARLWPDGDALDRALVVHPEGRQVRIVGIARDSKYRSLSEAARPHMYRPTAPSFSRSLLVRTEGDPRRTMREVQAALDRVGPGVVGFFPRTLDDHLAIDMLPTLAAARAATVLGVLALLLSTAGLYGIVMWFVEIRRREIGVRVALGASAGDVRMLVVRQAVAAAAPGLAAGIAMSMALTSFGRSLFVGVGSVDLPSLALASVALTIIVAIASYLPTRRATQVDPVIVLRGP